MYTGYNLIKEEVLKLKEHPTLWNKVVDKLKTIPVNKKVLRWPDGNESILASPYKPFNASENQVFIDLCKQGGVEKVTLRADFQDIEGSIDTYDQLVEAGLEVTFVEAGNEPYTPPQVNPTRSELIRLFWDFTQWNVNMDIRIFRLKAKQYANKVKNLRNEFSKRGHDLVGKFAYALPLPRHYKDLEWLRICMDILPKNEYSLVVLHPYNQEYHGNGFGEWTYWKTNVAESSFNLINSLGLDWIATEGNAIHFGPHGNTYNSELGNTSYHVITNQDLVSSCKVHGCKQFNYHKLFGFGDERLFHKWSLDIPRLTLTDRQPEFTL